MPIHCSARPLRVLRYRSKLSKTGWLYEAWIITPDATRIPVTCVFEEPRGLADRHRRLRARGLQWIFLKIMKYQAGDVARGAPLLVGRIGWEPRDRRLAPGEATPTICAGR